MRTTLEVRLAKMNNAIDTKQARIKSEEAKMKLAIHSLEAAKAALAQQCNARDKLLEAVKATKDARDKLAASEQATRESKRKTEPTPITLTGIVEKYIREQEILAKVKVGD